MLKVYNNADKQLHVVAGSYKASNLKVLFKYESIVIYNKLGPVVRKYLHFPMSSLQ